ncbi:MAG: arylsulfatase [Planctomycetota bacterium]
MLVAFPLFAGDRPNIVIILADDMGYSDIGCYGSEIPTPNLDKLAANGVRFTQFYNTGRCCPSRASLLTGRYAHAAGVGHMVYGGDKGPGYHGYLTEDSVTLAEALKPAGYQTFMSGKWHVGHAKGQWPTDRGFDRFFGIHIHVDSFFRVLKEAPVYRDGKLAIAPTEGPVPVGDNESEWYTTDVFTTEAIRMLDERDHDKPFMLYIAHNAPHWPLEAPQENIENFVGKYMAGWTELRQARLDKMKSLGLVAEGVQLPPSDAVRWESLSDDDRENLDFRMAIYAAMIQRMDQNIGRLINKLEAEDELDNTIIFFLSDNGGNAEAGPFGYQFKKNRKANFEDWRTVGRRSSSIGLCWAEATNTPFRMFKKYNHEGGIATPLIVHWPAGLPEQSRGKLTTAVGHVIDFMPTCLELAGAAYPTVRNGNKTATFDGKSLVSAFDTAATQELRGPLFWEHEYHAAVRVGGWKLVTLDFRNDDAWELYHLKVDRNELNNLAEQQPDLVQSMRSAWHTWAKKNNVVPKPVRK